MHGDAGFVDGTMIAKKLPCYTSSNMGSLQYHGAHYLGPMQCKPCIDATSRSRRGYALTYVDRMRLSHRRPAHRKLEVRHGLLRLPGPHVLSQRPGVQGERMPKLPACSLKRSARTSRPSTSAKLAPGVALRGCRTSGRIQDGVGGLRRVRAF